MTRDRYAQCNDTCTVDCGACKGAGRPNTTRACGACGLTITGPRTYPRCPSCGAIFDGDLRLTRTLAEVAREIGTDWRAMSRPYTMVPRFGVRNGHPAHAAYFAMRTLHTTDLTTSVTLGNDPADDAGTAADVVRAFLESAGPWHGVTAARVKAELRDALAHHDVENHVPSDLIH